MREEAMATGAVPYGVRFTYSCSCATSLLLKRTPGTLPPCLHLDSHHLQVSASPTFLRPSSSLSSEPRHLQFAFLYFSTALLGQVLFIHCSFFQSTAARGHGVLTLSGSIYSSNKKPGMLKDTDLPDPLRLPVKVLQAIPKKATPSKCRAKLLPSLGSFHVSSRQGLNLC